MVLDIITIDRCEIIIRCLAAIHDICAEADRGNYKADIKLAPSAILYRAGIFDRYLILLLPDEKNAFIDDVFIKVFNRFVDTQDTHPNWFMTLLGSGKYVTPRDKMYTPYLVLWRERG